MGECAYCGKAAGFLRGEHKECAERHNQALTALPNFFEKALTSDIAPERFAEMAVQVAEAGFIAGDEWNKALAAGMQRLADAALADNLLSADEERRIVSIAEAFGDATIESVRERLVKAAILRDLDDGLIPDRVKIDNLTINMARGERLLWLFNDAKYLATRSRTQYAGSSHGVSLRIASGVYYRVGASRGEPIKTDYLSLEGVGSLFISDRALYFVGAGKALKIPATKIIAVNAFEDGFQIARDGASAKPAIFMVDDVWFAANLISRLNQVA